MFFPTLCCYLLFLIYVGFACCFAIARDTITFNNPINSSGGPLIISAAQKFALGFFSTPTPSDGSSNGGGRYVGIWYYSHGVEPRTIVWVANRDQPVSVSNSRTWFFGIGMDGNLCLFADIGLTGNRNSTPPKKLTTLHGISAPWTRTLKLMDSGNLVLTSDQHQLGGDESYINNGSTSTTVVWQSFLDPTDTFLPGMLMSEKLRLISWKSQHDPSPGQFVFRRDVERERERENEYIITDNEAISYWKSRLSGDFISNSNDEILPFVSEMLQNFSQSDVAGSGKCSGLKPSNSKYYCNITQTQSYGYKYNNTRLVMGWDGKLRFLIRYNQTDTKWHLDWSEPMDRCSVFDACGKFGSCNKDNKLLCNCLPGFKPQSPDNWNDGDFSEGCIRKSSVCSQRGKVKEFFKLSMMKVQKPNSVFAVKNQSECESKCLESCICQAYSFKTLETYLRGSPSNTSCGIWIEDLQNIQESSTDGGLDLYLRVQLSETGKRTCKTCGTNVVPYPLSTGPTCGDPDYFSFNCQTESDTGQISFNASGRTYRVTSIHPETQTFSIQVQNAEECRVRDSMEKLLLLPTSSPFFVRSDCNAAENNFSTDSTGEDKWFYEVEIGWKQPPEPICSSSKDCQDWPNSSCKISRDGKRRCSCNPSFQWDPSIGSCTTDQASKKPTPLYLIFLGMTAAMLVIFCFASALYHNRRRRTVTRQERNWELRMYNSERRVIEFMNSGVFRDDDKRDIDVPHFDLESILIATDNFAEANKLGQGGFGPVYKGKLQQGQEIAIKRLSSGSGQGLEEFKNEVVLIAKLQHRNLVRLVGYSVKGYEKMLIYEYMPNRSLDSFIFDRTRCLLINWEKRIEIILGIARGMLYLHQDSRLRVIHRDLKTSNILLDEDRDLKTSNILLDEEMNPKISDFGLARIFGGKQTEASTERVVGTYGYMSPEYALDGFFSIKSDVFSFGVVLLETISGKRNTGFYQAEQPLSLLGYAWRLWKDGRALDLAEQAMRQSCNANEFVRCVNVGLLCVQEDPSDRPTMSDVLFMLGSESATLPIPKQPAYVVRRSISTSASSSSKQQWNSELTTTLEEGR